MNQVIICSQEETGVKICFFFHTIDRYYLFSISVQVTLKSVSHLSHSNAQLVFLSKKKTICSCSTKFIVPTISSLLSTLKALCPLILFHNIHRNHKHYHLHLKSSNPCIHTAFHLLLWTVCIDGVIILYLWFVYRKTLVYETRLKEFFDTQVTNWS